MEQFIILPNKSFDYVNTGNPAITTNPVFTGASWLNMTTGELFFCTDNTVGLNVWRGQLGTIILSPLSLNPAAWYDFSDATTLFTDAGITAVTADTDLIYQANDKSANTNNLVSATAASRPQYKTAIQNGKSIARFAGTNDYLLSSFGINLANITLFTVSNITGTLNNARIVSINDSSAATDYASPISLALEVGVSPNNVAAVFNSVALIGVGTRPAGKKIHTLHKDGGIATLSVNGTSVDTKATWTGAGTCSGSIALATLLANGAPSGAFYLIADYSEVLVFDFALSASQISGIELYLNNKWGIY